MRPAGNVDAHGKAAFSYEETPAARQSTDYYCTIANIVDCILFYRAFVSRVAAALSETVKLALSCNWLSIQA